MWNQLWMNCHDHPLKPCNELISHFVLRNDLLNYNLLLPSKLRYYSYFKAKTGLVFIAFNAWEHTVITVKNIVTSDVIKKGRTDMDCL
jgi:hypothetical protein